MKEDLVKSFDNLMFQQEKMDNKAYIFIGFIAFCLTNIYSKTELFNYISQMMIVTIFPLCCSLLPIANKFQIKLLKYLGNPPSNRGMNIFYYIDICSLTEKEFVQKYMKEYTVPAITDTDKKLIEQILTNARILRLKVFWHNLFQISLIASIMFILLISWI